MRAGLVPGWRLLRAVVVLAAAVVGAGTARAQDPVAVDFEVDLRAEIAAGRFDPARDRVTVRGSVAPLSWFEGVPLEPRPEGRQGALVRLERRPYGGQPLPHKFRIERAGQGDDEGWEPGPNHAAVLQGDAPRVSRVFGAPVEPVPPHIEGTVLTLGPVPTRHVPPRAVQIWLPPGYDQQPTRRYPVLYLHDGQNVFDGRPAGAEWQADETAQRLVRSGAIAPLIIVGVPSGPDRMFELTPTAMRLPVQDTGKPQGAPTGGGALSYARFLVDDLKPFIDRRFRTRPQPPSTAVGGSSLGGLVSLWLALHHGDTFGAALVVSPSVWWDDGFIVRDVQAYAAASKRDARRPRLWLDMGGHEGAQALPDVRRLRDGLVAAGWTAGVLAYTEDPQGSHDELSWAARFEGMLRFLDAGFARPAVR